MERFEANTVAEALQQARDERHDSRFDRVLSVSSVLVDGLVVRGEALDRVVLEPVRVEILPPFAGGSGVPADLSLSLNQFVCADKVL